MNKKMKKGFTLVELMIVVAIMAILAAVSAPRFGAQIKKAKDAKGLSVVSTWRSANDIFYTDKFEFADGFGELDDYVDDATKRLTYDSTMVTQMSTTALGDTVTGAAIEVGTGETLNSKQSIVLSYTGTNASTSAAVNISTTANDTQGNPWNNK